MITVVIIRTIHTCFGIGKQSDGAIHLRSEMSENNNIDNEERRMRRSTTMTHGDDDDGDTRLDTRMGGKEKKKDTGSEAQRKSKQTNAPQAKKLSLAEKSGWQ